MTELQTRLRPLIDAVEARRASGAFVVLSMDGMAAAGKTTAAEYLSALWDAPVVHMDNFFLPPALRTPERLSQPGGNIHYERFSEEVLPALIRGETFSYRPFSCASMSYAPATAIPKSDVVIVEGAYAMHPAFGDYAHVTAFFAIEPEEQKRRILRRDPEKWEDFRTRWIPMEAAYHEAFQIKKNADVVV